MLAYIVRRLLLMIPTLLGIMILNFFIIQAAPGGPVEQMIAKLEGRDTYRHDAHYRFRFGDQRQPAQAKRIRAARAAIADARGLDPQFIEQIQKMYGFDKPAYERFLDMMRTYAVFDFGNSFFKGRPVIDLILEKMPVSISIGLWTTLIGYLVSIPLGIAKARARRFPLRFLDHCHYFCRQAPSRRFSSPSLLIVLFAGGRYFHWFPLRGLVSDNWWDLSWPDKIRDYFWHMTLPLIAMTIGGFAASTLLVKNSFLDQMNHLYVSTARAKGLTQRQVLYGHVFRNAMLIVVAGIPGAVHQHLSRVVDSHRNHLLPRWLGIARL